jgi:hypothetical protein
MQNQRFFYFRIRKYDSKKKEDRIEWAKKKADWHDPSIAYEDEFLGVRDHGRDEEYKKLMNSYGYW